MLKNFVCTSLLIAIMTFYSSLVSAGTLDGKDLPTIQQRRLVLNPSSHTVFPEVYCNVANVEQIDIYSNSLTTLPSCINKFGRTLRSLSIASNTSLTALPSEVGQLVFLETLTIKQTALATLPSQISGARKLQNIQIVSGKLTSLPREIGDLVSLETLDLSNNLLPSLPEEMGLLTSLSNLNLSNNKLTVAPVFLPYLVNLKTITFTGNPLATSDAQKEIIKNIFKDRQTTVTFD